MTTEQEPAPESEPTPVEEVPEPDDATPTAEEGDEGEDQEG